MPHAEDAVSDTKSRPLAIRAAYWLWNLLRRSADRHVFWLNWRRSSGVFQPYNETRISRYPRIFGFVQSELGRDGNHRILSFGCSTGEEVQNLRRYFPNAIIKGIDVNPGNIAACKKAQKRSGDEAATFEIGNSTEAEPSAIYDAIFCMAVLRHGGLGKAGVTRCDHLIRFERFAQVTTDFSRCLKPGGLLIIRHSNFRFCDTPAAVDFETILQRPYVPTRRTPIFGPDNQLMENATYFDTVFRKTR